MPEPRAVATAYLSALEAADLEAILTLFAGDAAVVSPLYGTVSAAQFFETLLTETSASRLTLKTVFEAAEDTSSIAILFDYEWDLANGRSVDFPVVDVMELDGLGKISKLTIIYDATEARAAIST